MYLPHVVREFIALTVWTHDARLRMLKLRAFIIIVDHHATHGPAVEWCQCVQMPATTYLLQLLVVIMHYVTWMLLLSESRACSSLWTCTLIEIFHYLFTCVFRVIT